LGEIAVYLSNHDRARPKSTAPDRYGPNHAIGLPVSDGILHYMSKLPMSLSNAPAQNGMRKRIRRLKPEIAARLAAQQQEDEIQKLYNTPVEQLSPEDLAKMKAAFFQR
jgi:hypothetical protein